MDKDVKHWVGISRYDLDTAKAMLSAHRYVYVLFTCQQALEKLLKALVICETGKFPPRIHNLLKLAEKAKLELSEEEKVYMEKLNYYYIGSRYPEAVRKIAEDVTKKLAEDYYDKTVRIWKRLRLGVR